ncbi:hypothetical protein ACFXHA_15935 [Nocardia sp. NPDC059240]|uniref:DUF7373 family lipoprotein n=1 Tax=Nocardia sp. NPDC059240 TaxID=3346786 RepID=UPI0036D07B1B
MLPGEDLTGGRSTGRLHRTRPGQASCLAVAVLASACAIAGTPRPTQPDLGGLDLTGYGGQALSAPADTTYGGLLESARMSEAMVSPGAIDPALRTVAAAPVPAPAAAVGILADATVGDLARYGMLAGFSIGGTDADSGPPQPGTSRSVRLTVLRMHDETAAIDAARRIDADDAAVNRDNVDIPFPEYFATYGHWRPYVASMAATLAHGPFVVTLYITAASTDRTALRAMATATFDAELPRLDAFAPTPAEALSALPLDPAGMLSRILPADPGKWPYPEVFVHDDSRIAGWGGQRDATGVVYGPVEAAAWSGFADAAPETMAVAGSTHLLRFSDAVAARKALLRRKAATQSQFAASPPGIPDALCLADRAVEANGDAQAVTCLVLHGRYLAVVYGPDETTAHRKASAQYALLVRAT